MKEKDLLGKLILQLTVSLLKRSAKQKLGRKPKNKIEIKIKVKSTTKYQHKPSNFQSYQQISVGRSIYGKVLGFRYTIKVLNWAGALNWEPLASIVNRSIQILQGMHAVQYTKTQKRCPGVAHSFSNMWVRKSVLRYINLYQSDHLPSMTKDNSIH